MILDSPGATMRRMRLSEVSKIKGRGAFSRLALEARIPGPSLYSVRKGLDAGRHPHVKTARRIEAASRRLWPEDPVLATELLGLDRPVDPERE